MKRIRYKFAIKKKNKTTHIVLNDYLPQNLFRIRIQAECERTKGKNESEDWVFPAILSESIKCA